MAEGNLNIRDLTDANKALLNLSTPGMWPLLPVSREFPQKLLVRLPFLKTKDAGSLTGLTYPGRKHIRIQTYFIRMQKIKNPAFFCRY